MTIAQDVAMKFSIAQTELLHALQTVSSAVPSRSTLPVLSNILVQVKQDSIELTGTDLDLAVTTRVQADVKSEGSLTVPAKRLLELVRKLPREELKLEAKELSLHVGSKTGRFKFLCIRPDEFPARINITPEVTFNLEARLLERLIKRTSYAVSTDETRPALNGALVQLAEGQLRIVATDGHRLAYATLKRPGIGKSSLKGDVIVPLKALNLLLRLLSESGEPVELQVSKNHARFTVGGTSLTTKLIEGPFPNYEQVLPKQNNKVLTVNRDELAAALDRVSIFSDSLTRQVRFSVGPDRLKLIVQTPDQGEATEELGAAYASEELDIGYNANYILDSLRTMDSNEVVIKLNTPVTAGLLIPAPAGGESTGVQEELLCLVMPLRLAG